jgi:hypothetical protein
MSRLSEMPGRARSCAWDVVTDLPGTHNASTFAVHCQTSGDRRRRTVSLAEKGTPIVVDLAPYIVMSVTPQILSHLRRLPG